MWSRVSRWRMRPRPAIRFGCRWWMRGRCGWNRFRLFAGSARIEGNAIWSVVVGHRWAACRVRVVAGTRPDAAGLRPDGDRYRLPAVWLRWSEGSGRPVARRRHRDRAPCHADVVQPVGVAGHRFPRTPGDYRPLLYRPAWRRQAARLRPEVMTPARLSSLRGMALQCSRTHDQDV